MSTAQQTPARQRWFDEINEIVKLIPPGSVMTYGQVASEIRANARVVGWAMANVTDPDVPWQRVVGADGYLRIGRRSTELMALQRSLLLSEGVAFLANGHVDMEKHNADYLK